MGRGSGSGGGVREREDGSLYGAAVGWLGLLLALRFGLRWPWLAAWLVATSLVTLVLYGFDKRAATRGARRVPEAVLHLFALLGGSPGALLGQQLFRHKTRKLRFQVVFWAIVAAQLVLVVLWQTGHLG